MTDWWVDLHAHSTYSTQDGYGLPEQIRDRLIELGQFATGVTDHGVITGLHAIDHCLSKAGLKAIPGCEFYTCPDMRERGVKAADNPNEEKKARASFPHITILAANQTGLKNLLKLSTASFREGFYYKPRVDYNEILKHQSGLILMTGCVGSHLAKLINSGKEELAFQWLGFLKQRVERLYCELIPCPSLDISHKHCQAIWKMAHELRIPLVVTSDAHFPAPEHHAAEDTMTARAIGVTVDTPDRKLQIPHYHYRCSGDQILARLQVVLPDVPEVELRAVMTNSLKIASQCDTELPRASGPIFNVQAAFKEMKVDLLTKMPRDEALLGCWVDAGVQLRRQNGELPDLNSDAWEVYVKREAYEFEILKHHGFINYCLVVADIVRWARQENILCIARGSCGGSLLAWYLGITELDPIKYDLPVERFIGFHRKGLPDIDLDVDARYRDRFWNYLTQKYGEENCAQITALSRFRARQALRDVAAAHSLPDEALAAMLDLVPEAAVADEGLKAVGTLKRLFAENDRAQVLVREYPAFLIAAELEGQIRQSTTHAAGFVVDARPISETVGIMGKPDTLPIAACDMVEAEHLGLLKIDLLAVDMLSVLASVTEGLGHDLNWLRALPLDDAATYEMLGEGRNAGVFQLQGNAAGRLMRDLQPTQFQDICNITALARPGPLQSGGAQSFVARQRGRQPRLHLHPILDAILAPTQDIVLYQEQVMRVAREAGQYDWPEVEAIRKTVSKIEGAAAMERFLDGYLMGCAEQGIPERDALLVWDQCCKSGNYTFNAAHGYAYAKIAVWSAYLKRHHPARFAAAFAQFEEDPDLRRRIFNEFRDLGGKFVLIDPNRSQAHFTTLDDHTILGGFQDLEGCGPKNATKLVAGQPYADWDAFYQACPKTVRDHLHATGIHEGRVDQDAVLHVAPWYVEITYTDLERAAFQRMSATTVAATHHADRQVSLVGRVTQVQIINVVAEAKKYGQRPPGPGEPTTRAVVTLADETGSTLLHISPRRLEQLIAQRNPLRGPYEGVGNSVYAACSWNRPHTKLYCEDLICFREAPLFVPATPEHLDPVLTKKRATRKRKKADIDETSLGQVETNTGADQNQSDARCQADIGNGGPSEVDGARSPAGEHNVDGRYLQGNDADREALGNNQRVREDIRETAGGDLRERGATPDPIVDGPGERSPDARHPATSRRVVAKASSAAARDPIVDAAPWE